MAIPNIKDYNKKKAKNLISLQKIDDENVAIGTKRFDADYGVELPVQVVGVTLTEVKEAIAAKQAELDELKAFKADLLAAA